jgi:hypothetical protein
MTFSFIGLKMLSYGEIKKEKTLLIKSYIQHKIPFIGFKIHQSPEQKVDEEDELLLGILVLGLAFQIFLICSRISVLLQSQTNSSPST